MELIITGRHTNLTPELKKYIEARSKKMEKYVSKPMKTTITLKTEKHRQHAEVHVNINGTIMQAQDETEEIHLSVDSALSKIEKQLKKYKEKASSHRGAIHEGKETPSKKKAVPSKPALAEAPSLIAGKEVVRISQVETTAVNCLTLEEALSEMKLHKKDFFLFWREKNRQLHLL